MSSVVPISQNGPQVAITLGDMPTNILCPYCSTNVTTFTTRKNGCCFWCMIWMCGVLLCCCDQGFQDVEHSCPNCRQVIGLKKSGCC